jgi:hypothetical protein
MRKFYTSILMICIGYGSFAQSIINEPFNYTVGQSLQGQNGGTGFTTGWDKTGTDVSTSIGQDANATILSGSINPTYGTGNRLQICIEPGKTARFDRTFPVTFNTDGQTYWVGFWYRSSSVADNTTYGIAGQLIFMNSANSTTATDQRLGFGKTSNFTGASGVNSMTTFTRASSGGCAAQNWPGSATAATALNLPSNATYYVLVKIIKKEFVDFNIGSVAAPVLANLDGIRVWFLSQPPSGSGDAIFTNKPFGDIFSTDAITSTTVPIQTRLLRGGADNTGNTTCKKDGVNGIRFRAEGGSATNTFCAEFDEIRVGQNLDADILLPVKFGELYASARGNSNLISWSTFSETRNRGFFVEQSKNGIDWSSIGFVAGKGNSVSKTDYSFVDAQVFPVTYYRIRQQDFDGKETVSNIVRVANNGHAVLEIFPNPAHQWLTLQLHGSAASGNVDILDLAGKRLQTTMLTAQQQKIDISALPAGTYILTAVMNGTRIHSKFVKQ